MVVDQSAHTENDGKADQRQHDHEQRAQCDANALGPSNRHRLNCGACKWSKHFLSQSFKVLRRCRHCRGRVSHGFGLQVLWPSNDASFHRRLCIVVSSNSDDGLVEFFRRDSPRTTNDWSGFCLRFLRWLLQRWGVLQSVVDQMVLFSPTAELLPPDCSCYSQRQLLLCKLCSESFFQRVHL